MYNKIINPITGEKVNIFGKLGRKILEKYIHKLSGGAQSIQVYNRFNPLSWKYPKEEDLDDDEFDQLQRQRAWLPRGTEESYLNDAYNTDNNDIVTVNSSQISPGAAVKTSGNVVGAINIHSKGVDVMKELKRDAIRKGYLLYEVRGQNEAALRKMIEDKSKVKVESQSPASTSASLDSPSPETSLETPSPETSLDSPSPETSLDSPSPETSLDSPRSPSSPSSVIEVALPGVSTTKKSPLLREDAFRHSKPIEKFTEETLCEKNIHQRTCYKRYSTLVYGLQEYFVEKILKVEPHNSILSNYKILSCKKYRSKVNIAIQELLNKKDIKKWGFYLKTNTAKWEIDIELINISDKDKKWHIAKKYIFTDFPIGSKREKLFTKQHRRTARKEKIKELKKNIQDWNERRINRNKFACYILRRNGLIHPKIKYPIQSILDKDAIEYWNRRQGGNLRTYYRLRSECGEAYIGGATKKELGDKQILNADNYSYKIEQELSCYDIGYYLYDAWDIENERVYIGGGIYNYIINPKTLQKVNIKSRLGKHILNSYLNNN